MASKAAEKAKAKVKDLKAELKAMRKELAALRKAARGPAAATLAAVGPAGAPAEGATSAAPAPARGRKAVVVSPLAPAAFPDLPAIAGVEFAAAAAGVRYPGRTDVMLARLAPGTAIAGAFTRSRTRSASVLDCEAKLARGDEPGAGAAIIVNSGNANAFTGAAGAAAVAEVTGAVAAALGLPAGRVFSASTGVIGEPLPVERIVAVTGALAATLAPADFAAAARAIMTTDTFPKGAAAGAGVGGTTLHVAGIAKGSGMVAPDLATMLVYIFTDAAVAPPTLQRMLTRNLGATFNAITVDSDTSTSDMVLVAATGQAGNPPLADLRSRDARAFERALAAVMRDLALQVVRDGEGATRLVEVRVTGAVSDAEARQVAMAIANSPLVKTAIAGGDPNWGRIVMAVGKSGAEADRDRLTIRFGDLLVAEAGSVAPGYREADGAACMRAGEIVIGVDLGLGSGRFTAFTCDLTHRYIDINADYRS
ncbi:MAG: bifunctional glutamate N-acetyltransferase/amino-acid acetyltransferase ArgJ [Rhodobacteraceae bacterium]|nr:bifunctional glutamate N-acetyltransferase/amino-acid acetyltransferase ArgJ [Paracoccaceae bacterium]